MLTSSDIIIQQFERNYSVLLSHAMKDLTQEDSLIHPPPGCNSINWHLGHIVLHRDYALNLVGKDDVMGAGKGAPYGYGSELGKTDGFLPIDELLSLMKESHDLLKAAIEPMSPEDLEFADENHENMWLRKPRNERLLFLSFHEGWHMGEISTVRRLIGKGGAV